MSLNTYEGTASQTSSSLLRSAKRNDPAAWRRIVDTYSRRIYRWCRQAQLQPEDASDVVQEVFRAVARKLIDFHHDHDGDSFRGWLYRITQNKIRDHASKRPGRFEKAWGGTDAQRQFNELADAESDSASTRKPKQTKTEFELAIERIQSEFSDRDWKVFWRVVVDGQTSREAGEQFEMSSNAVRLVKMRILRRFRELVQTEFPHAPGPQ
jgi:RNA polymerase sigma-70 factor (ECF subfamily)